MEFDTGFLFQSWGTLARTAIVGGLAYAALVCMLRVSGKRTLAKMNGFDFVVTVAFGSTLATILLSRDVSLAEGVTAFSVLILLQWCLTWLSVRSGRVRRATRAEPRLLLQRGEMLRDAMRQARVTESELFQALRSHGVLSLQDVEAVVLETNGELSVLRRAPAPGITSLSDVPAHAAR